MEKGDEFDTDVGGAGFRPVLLVIGGDIGFSDPLQQYAVDMSLRMGYRTLAVNISPRRRRRALLATRDDTGADDEVQAAQAVGADDFRRRMEEADVPFEAIARTGALDSVVRRLHRERDDIDLVIMEPEYVDEEEDGPRSIPAFSLAPGA
jgi:hypothetical protein